MSYKYLFHEAAQKDYEVAVRWYLGKSDKVAKDFITGVDNTLELICNNPTRW